MPEAATHIHPTPFTPSTLRFIATANRILRRNVLLGFWLFVTKIVDYCLSLTPLALVVLVLASFAESDSFTTVSGLLVLIYKLGELVQTFGFWVTAGGAVLVSLALRWCVSCFMRAGVYGVLGKVCRTQEISSEHGSVIADSIKRFGDFIRYALFELVVQAAVVLVALSMALGCVIIVGTGLVHDGPGLLELSLLGVWGAAGCTLIFGLGLLTVFTLASFHLDRPRLLEAVRQSTHFILSHLAPCARMFSIFLAIYLPVVGSYATLGLVFSVVRLDPEMVLVGTAASVLLDLVFSLATIYLGLLYVTSIFLYYAHQRGLIDELPTSKPKVESSQKREVVPIPESYPNIFSLSDIVGRTPLATSEPIRAPATLERSSAEDHAEGHSSPALSAESENDTQDMVQEGEDPGD